MSDFWQRLSNISKEELIEQALQRKDAVNRCCDLGWEFIKHFHKVVKEGVYSPTFNHHCREMQAWWDKVKNIRVSDNKKLISTDNLINWFFTAGSDIESIIKDEYQNTYSKLMLLLLSDYSLSVKEAFKKVLPQ